MKLAAQKHAELLSVFQPTERGVLGLVDDLLKRCNDSLQLDWHAGHCRIHIPTSDDTVEVALPKSVFRAMLARIAALCNEHKPNSVSPYGGQGGFLLGANEPVPYHVTFTNTPGEQRLIVTRKSTTRDGN